MPEALESIDRLNLFVIFSIEASSNNHNFQSVQSLANLIPRKFSVSSRDLISYF